MDEQPVAVAVIRGPRGVLVGRRVDGVPPWVFVGGKIKPDETPEQAAVREAAEETGATVLALDEIGRRTHPRTGRLMVYIDCRSVDDDVRVAAPDELAEVRWVSPDALDELMPDLFGPVRGTSAGRLGRVGRTPRQPPEGSARRGRPQGGRECLAPDHAARRSTDAAAPARRTGGRAWTGQRVLGSGCDAGVRAAVLLGCCPVGARG